VEMPVTRFAVKDELLDAQTLRAAGTTAYGGADIGECLATARRVRGTDPVELVPRVDRNRSLG
jgi:hypothetical protein